MALLAYFIFWRTVEWKMQNFTVIQRDYITLSRHSISAIYILDLIQIHTTNIMYLISLKNWIG